MAQSARLAIVCLGKMVVLTIQSYHHKQQHSSQWPATMFDGEDLEYQLHEALREGEEMYALNMHQKEEIDALGTEVKQLKARLLSQEHTYRNDTTEQRQVHEKILDELRYKSEQVDTLRNVMKALFDKYRDEVTGLKDQIVRLEREKADLVSAPELQDVLDALVQEKESLASENKRLAEKNMNQLAFIKSLEK